MKKLIQCTAATSFAMLLAIVATAQFIKPTTDMNVKRIFHQAQPLGNGKVLVFGGQTTSSPTFQPIVHASCEIYDSATKTWTNAASMNFARTNHASVVTQSGKILAIGGDSAGTNSRLNVESYDPATDQWIMVGSLNKARNHGDAIVLDNGNIVVVSSYPSTIETGPPDGSGLWTESGVPLGERVPELPRIIRMNDTRILIVGSIPSAAPNKNMVLTQAGSLSVTANTTIEDHPNAGLALLPDGKIMVTGGTASGVNEIFDPATNMFSSTDNFNNSRLNCPLMKMSNGRVAVFGSGVVGNPDGERDVLEIYDPAAGQWQIKKGHKFWGTESYKSVPLGNGKHLITGGGEHMQLLTTGTRQCFIFDENATVSVDDIPAGEATINYYPSLRVFNIRINGWVSESYRADLYSPLGQTIKEYSFTGAEVSLQVPSGTANGIYILRVTGDNGGHTVSKKFFIQ